MSSIKISIIIPCYNRSNYLFEMLGTAPKSDDVELILVDDHSTEDLSKVYLSTYPNCKYIRNDSAQRYAGSARNMGIDNSVGEYLFFADSDDLFIVNGFMKCKELLHYDSPDVLFAMSTSFIDTKNTIGYRHIRNNWLVREVIHGEDSDILVRFGGPVAKFVRRDFVEQHRIRFEKQRVSNDIVFAALIMVNKPVVKVCDEIVYSIRQGNLSLTNELSIDNLETRLSALVRFNSILRSNGLKYLMVPASAHLLRLIFRSPYKVLIWIYLFLVNRQPLFMTYWTARNIMRRYKYWN
jgi:glycosyltransferase involved in cell wall biosynthesis